MNSINRRHFLQSAAVSLPVCGGLLQAADSARRPRVAVIYTICTYRSHAHVILENFLGPYLFNGKRTDPGVDVVSLYADQRPAGDMTNEAARLFDVPVFESINDALCVGGKELAVDAVLAIGEHGSYPRTKLGQTMYPRKRFFDECVATMKRSDRFVPYFNDKHLSYRWDEALEIYETARELGIPMMAGSSVPLATRRPPLEIPPGQVIDEALTIHGGPLESYDFHGLELLESMIESRKGGETGIASVEFLQGDDVWQAALDGRWSLDLFQAAMHCELRNESPEVIKDLSHESFKPMHALLVRFRDGVKGTVLRVGRSNVRWNFACRMNGDPEVHSTAFYVGPWENRNLFKGLSHAIQKFFINGKAPYPVERTLLVTGTLASAMKAAQTPGQSHLTPHLDIRYRPSDWNSMREMGATWKLITPDTPQPRGFHRMD